MGRHDRNCQSDIGKKRPYNPLHFAAKGIIEQKLLRLKALYPDFQGSDIFFVVGIFNSRGTVKGKHILIGTGLCEFGV